MIRSALQALLQAGGLSLSEEEFVRRWEARFRLRWEQPPLPRFRACDYRACEARCCYDGVYLQGDDQQRIQEARALEPAAFQHLPATPLVMGSWEGSSGLKTATRPHTYQSPDFPPHFTQTRCVFRAGGRRVLPARAGRTAEREGGWRYKPRGCWAHPLRSGRLTATRFSRPPPGQADPDSLGARYPGYLSYTPCGQAREDGEPDALEKERRWLEGGE